MRRILLVLDREEFARLEKWAEQEDRVVDQQVRHIIREALRRLEEERLADDAAEAAR